MNVDGVKASIPGKLVTKIGEDKALNWATLIAWSALLAMFPILLVGASIVGLTLGFAGVSEDEVVSHVSGAIRDPGTQELVKGALTSFKHQGGIFAAVGFVGLMFGGSALFGSMEQGFAIIYHTTPRSFLKQKLVAMVLIIPFSLLAGLVIATSSALPALKNLPNVPEFLSGGPVSYVLQVALGAFTGFLMFALIYYIVPNRRQQWNKVWPGALLAGTLFSLLVLLFPLYLEVNKGIQKYGQTPALFLTLMTFFFFLGIITMVGVEFNSVLYPLPVEQPGKADALAPGESGPEGEADVVGSANSDYPRRAGNSDSTPMQTPTSTIAAGPGVRIAGMRVPAAFAVGGAAWLAGLLVGRRAGRR